MVLRALSDLLLPPSCASCETWGSSPLCEVCERRVSWIGAASCRRCGAPTHRPSESCRLCEGAAFTFARAACAAVYEGPMRDAIVAFKLRGERRAAAVAARWMLTAAERLSEPAAITWVPSTRRTVAGRGFDPAASLARAFAGHMGRRAVPLLVKAHETADQASLDRSARAANLADAILPSGGISGGILLVDDIVTTGATADACARALCAAGADRVEVLALARAT